MGYYKGNRKTNSAFQKQCSGALTVCDGIDGWNEAVCLGSSLWNDLYWNTTYHFAVDENRDGCSNQKPIYYHMTYDEYNTEDILYRLEYVKNAENDFFNGTEYEQWALTKHYVKFEENATFQDFLVATCNKADIAECSMSEWDIKPQEGMLRDWAMPQLLEYQGGECSEALNVEEDDEPIQVSMVIAISLISAVLVIGGIIFYFCIYNKGKLQRNKVDFKGDKVADDEVAIRDEDGCVATTDMVEEIEIEREIDIA